MAATKRSTGDATNPGRGVPPGGLVVLKRGEAAPQGYVAIPLGRPIDMDHGSPWTPIEHRFWCGHLDDQQPTRLIELGTDSYFRLPSATFELAGGKRRTMLFENIAQTRDQILTLLSAAEKRRLKQHVSQTLSHISAIEAANA